MSKCKHDDRYSITHYNHAATVYSIENGEASPDTNYRPLPGLYFHCEVCDYGRIYSKERPPAWLQERLDQHGIHP